MGGHEFARSALGDVELNRGNVDRALKHYMIAARAGHDLSLKEVSEGYKGGHVTKDEYATTLRAHQDSQTEMRSEQRTKAYVVGFGDC